MDADVTVSTVRQLADLDRLVQNTDLRPGVQADATASDAV